MPLCLPPRRRRRRRTRLGSFPEVSQTVPRRLTIRGTAFAVVQAGRTAYRKKSVAPEKKKRSPGVRLTMPPAPRRCPRIPCKPAAKPSPMKKRKAASGEDSKVVRSRCRPVSLRQQHEHTVLGRARQRGEAAYCERSHGILGALSGTCASTTDRRRCLFAPQSQRCPHLGASH